MTNHSQVGAPSQLEHDHLAKLHEAAIALSGISSLTEFGVVATRQMELLLNFEIATIWRWLPEAELLELTWYSGWPRLHAGLRVARGQGIVGKAIAEMKPVQVSSYQESKTAIPVIAAGGLGSGMGVPLVVEGVVIGGLTGGHKLGRVYSDVERDLAQVRDGVSARGSDSH